MNFVLENYEKSWENIICFIGDNCAVSQSLANKTKKQMVGCQSHRFNLALQDILRDHEDVLEKVNKVMSKLKDPVPAGKLRKHTPLVAKTRNVTRWGSTFIMLERYCAIKDYIPKLDLKDIEEMTITKKRNDVVDSLFERLAEMESVTKALQSDTTTLSDARALFDTVIGYFPTTEDRLKANAGIIHSINFENAVRKIQTGEVKKLSTAGANLVFALSHRSAEKNQR